MTKIKAFKLHQFKALDDAQGIFEAIVAVFNNIDRAGDRIKPGAFKNTLTKWGAKGRPIPVIFSHEWDNLDAHIGEVLEAKEVEEGLYVKAQLDLEEDFAARVWKKMKRGTLAEFSFAYDEIQSEMIDQGEKASPRYINDLLELDLLEVGPTLVGMNPETQLLDVKSGARHTVKEFEMLQQIHDLSVALGAKCAEPDDSAGEGEGEAQDETGNGKSRGPSPSTLAQRVALELLEIE